ncbi:efflux RND transporter periplasmic adaptor subunit [Endozoicomonas sp. SM1973]|uniref:Efflux RND transporter periplasmic adaptor subunit n=1 Tax=Spartinivicinus marinus TaxID=2994442 RepID=A0A853IIA3_9GAMM|nr:efflux RND transporter periplasmic adaptor subunit [Spartinivicinus marinus]MCX4026249.1 efflux RND transporter periplasmic adaptor subunit [Spartinivicinus marinus]NYZ67336.1 efflux RND transporter periplasmic adaptor subunit [Spartinivicinus marinus]
MPFSFFTGFGIRRQLLFLSLFLLGLSGCSKQDSSSAAGPASMPATEVSVVTLAAEPHVVTVELPGRTKAYQMSDVRPQVGGILQKRLFKEGQDVEAGQVLYQINPATYQATYDNAKAKLVQAKAAVQSAQPKAERYQRLAKIGGVSKQDKDEAVATLREAQAAVVAYEAELKTAEINLEYAQIKAPISGRIGKSAATPGALVTADQTSALTTINQLDPINVDLSFSSVEGLKLRRQLESGQLKKEEKVQVKLTLEDGTAYSETGTLEFVGNSVEETTGTMELRAVIANPKYQLLPGMYVDATLYVGVDEQALLVPMQAVTRNAKGEATVWVVSANDKVEQRVVETSKAVKDKWLVSSGLKSGERVIVEGVHKVRTGQVVKAEEFQQDLKAVKSKAVVSNNSSSESLTL